MISQTYNGRPLYQAGKLYFQIKLNSNVIVKNKDTIQNDPGGQFAALFTKYNVQTTERPFAATQTPGFLKTYKISFLDTARVDSLILELSGITSHVAYAEKVPAVYSFALPWELQNGTAQSGSLYHLPLLNANLASNIYVAPGNVSGNNAVVAIVDDAVLTTHEDLANNIGPLNQNVTSTVNPSDPNPPLALGSASNQTHGTHVAGIAGGVTNNTVGIASIGWNNKLMCVKSSTVGGGLTAAWQGFEWAVLNGAKVINMSWGSGPAFSITEHSLCVWAKSNDVVLVAAAGNYYYSAPFYPAAYGEGATGQPWEVIDRRLVVAVSALDQNSDMSVWGLGSGSNFGSWVDVSAYGTNIMSTLAASTSTGSPINNQYGQFNGTSMAAPMISGIAGVMRSYNPGKSADEIIDCLINTANPDIYGSNHPSNQPGKLGSGRADAEAALRCITSTCTGTVNPIVIIVPSSPSLCANTTLTLTANQGASSYTWNTSAISQSIVISAPGTYSVLATYPGNCTATASIVFSAPPTLSVSLTTNTAICVGYSIAVLGATGSYSSLVWQPGGMTSNSIAVNPIAYTIYTITANPMCGGPTVTLGVSPSTYTQPLLNFPYTILSGSVISGPMLSASSPFQNATGFFILNSNVTVGLSATFNNARVAIAPNVKITVPNGATFNINTAELKTCGTSMWQGIKVDDGATLICDAQSGIYDAITAISSTHIPIAQAGIPPATIHVRSTLFNKNYNDISITNFYDFFASSSYSNSLKVDDCVFTCRNFTITWPSPGQTFPNGTVLGMRGVSNPSPGLGTPYGFYNYPFATLKSPYSGQISNCAIFLSNNSPSNTVTGNDFVIGNITAPSYFNLFDYHKVFVNAQNCNVTLQNNVFQNQIHDIIPPQNIATQNSGLTIGGWGNNSAAIMHRTFSSTLSTWLQMSAPNFSLSNRFFDCIRAVEGYNVGKFEMGYCIARSTHTADGINISGASAVNIRSFLMNYDIHDNEFSNIKDAINIALTAGFLVGYQANPPQPVYGNYLTALAINNNKFNAGSNAGNFMNQAVNITNDLGVVPNSPSPLPQLKPVLPNYGWINNPLMSTTFRPTGVGIINNSISGARNGVNVNGFTGFPVWIAQNNFTLVNNPSLAQFGIRLDNGTANTPRQQSVWLNNVQGAGNTGNNMSLIYCSSNSGNTSPLINCNSLKDATKGFVFSGINNILAQSMPGIQWLGNNMQNLQNGMRLEGFVNQQNVLFQGVIGQQGGNTLAMGNYWNGNTWGGSNYNIWTESSNAANSPLYHITSNVGNMTLGSNNPLYPYSSSSIYTTSINNFLCDLTQYFVQPFPGTLNPEFSSLQVYLLNAQKFHFLRYNNAERAASSVLQNWYTNIQNNSNLEALELVQEKLFRGDYIAARANMAGIVAENYIEQKTIDFYNLYANYAQGINQGTEYSRTDSISLVHIASLCPVEYGAVVYKARALLNSIYAVVVNYTDCGGASMGSRQVANINTGILNQTEAAAVDIYPNPASNKLIIRSSVANEEIYIRIFDMTGREVLSKQLKTDNYSGVIDLDLSNGAYIATITNAQDQFLTKKILIAK
jgi:hypothetical protein